MCRLSEKLRAAIKLSDRRAYLIAHQAGIHPATLSKLLNGIEVPKPEDPRVLAVARVLGISPHEAFSDNCQEAATGGRECQG
jgi:hypothetical protein